VSGPRSLEEVAIGILVDYLEREESSNFRGQGYVLSRFHYFKLLFLGILYS